MTQIDVYISKLGLRPQGLELMNPEKAEAFAALKRLGAEAIDPMVQALNGTDDGTTSSIVELLGLTQDPRAIPPIVEKLNHASSSVRWSAVNSLGKFQASQLESGQVLPVLQEMAVGDPDARVREVTRDALKKAGIVMPEPPWYAGASGWLKLTEAFTRSELKKPNPDYQGFAERLAAVSAAERHGAWTRIAGDVRNKMASTRCYLEALYHDPDPNSIAWGWLNGDLDRADSVMHVLGRAVPRTRETVESLRDRIGPITEEGANSPYVLEVSEDTLDQARASAAAKLGAALPLAEESIVNSNPDPVMVIGKGKTADGAFAALEAQLPVGAIVIEKVTLQAAQQRIVQVEAFNKQEAQRQAERAASGDEAVDELRLVTAGTHGFLGIGKRPDQYEACLMSKTQVQLTYRRKILLRYLIYRRCHVEPEILERSE